MDGHERSTLCETPAEELASSLAHAVGAALSIFALILMVVRAEGTLAVTSMAIFGASLTTLYLSSTCDHIFKAVTHGKNDHWISTAVYVAMGWLVVIAGKPLVQSMETGGLILLVAGGLSYSFGVIFFVWERMRFNHAIWHLFVMTGSACHVIAVTGYVL